MAETHNPEAYCAGCLRKFKIFDFGHSEELCIQAHSRGVDSDIRPGEKLQKPGTRPYNVARMKASERRSWHPFPP